MIVAFLIRILAALAFETDWDAFLRPGSVRQLVLKILRDEIEVHLLLVFCAHPTLTLPILDHKWGNCLGFALIVEIPVIEIRFYAELSDWIRVRHDLVPSRVPFGGVGGRASRSKIQKLFYGNYCDTDILGAIISNVLYADVDLNILLIICAVFDSDVNDLELLLFLTQIRSPIRGEFGIEIPKFTKIQAHVITEYKAVVRFVGRCLVHAMSLELWSGRFLGFGALD